MRKYKTWEVIKMLEENPKQRFQATSCTGAKVEMYVDSDRMSQPAIEWTGNCQPMLTNTVMKYEWELIQQAIPFLEAVKAYSEGKTIRSERAYGDFTYKPGTNGDYFVDARGNAPCISEILEGKWYVEDSNE